MSKGGKIDSTGDFTQRGLMQLKLWLDPWFRPGGGGGHVIQDEGVDLPQQPNLNFAGAGVTATDDPPDTTLVTIPGVTPGVPTLSDTILALTGLDAFWKLNEAAGATVALDSSGNGYSLAAISGNTLPTFGATGAGIGPTGEQSALFDYDISHGDALYRNPTPAAPTNNFTAFGWMRFGTSVGTDLDCIFSRSDAGTGAQTTGWRVWLDNADYRLRLTINAATEIAGNAVLSPSTWYMWAVKRDAGTWSLYVDGVEQTAHTSTAPTASNNIRLGSFGQFLNRGWEGYQSYVALLSSALTSAEILNLFNTAGFAGTAGAGMVYTNPGSSGTPYWAYPVTTWIDGV